MLLIVTRPLAQATGWVQQLQALGCNAQALPLIQIAPVAHLAVLADVWQRLAHVDLAMFVSANAVTQFFVHAPLHAAWPGHLLAGSTGPGTSAALRAAGVPQALVCEPPADAERFDSEALWAQLNKRPWAGRHVLVVRGEDGRDWLADTLQAHGASVEFVAAYRRELPTLGAAEQALLQRAVDAPAAHLWLFSSSEAVRNLLALPKPGADAARVDWAASRALASHPRIAQAARDAGFGQVLLCAPSAMAVAALAADWPSIESAPS